MALCTLRVSNQTANWYSINGRLGSDLTRVVAILNANCRNKHFSVIKRVFCMMPIIAKSLFTNEPRLMGHLREFMPENAAIPTWRISRENCMMVQTVLKCARRYPSNSDYK